MPRQSLIEFLTEYPRHGREIAFAQRSGYRMERWSYRDIVDVAARFARELEGRGIVPGDRVVLWGRNSAEWVAAFFGCILRGAIAVPIDQGAMADFLGRVAQQVDAKLVVSGAEHELAGEGRPRLALDTLRETVARHSPETYPSPPLDRSSFAQIIFTSGTTADPKGVVISHGNILANLEPLEAAMKPYLKWERLFHPPRLLDLVPLSHVFGQFLGMWVPPLLGATVLFQDTLNPSEIISTIKRERVSVLITVPRVLESLEGKIERDLDAGGLLESFSREFDDAKNEEFLRRMWRFRRIHRRFGWKFWAVISGGATLEADTEQFWGRLGYAAIQGYGMTETTSLISVNDPFRIGRGSIGKVLEGREVKLDTSGEILVRGENIAAGYWQDRGVHPISEDDKGGEQDGWFHTGDLGSLDAEGNLYFKGRSKNVIVTPAGMNVYPEDLETLLRREPEVRDCVVVGLERGGNSEPCAVLLLRDERKVKQPRHAAGMIARVNESLAEYQKMRSWFLWPEADFPRTATGKPSLPDIRVAVEAQWGAGDGAVPPPVANGSIGEIIAQMQGDRAVAAGPGADLENDLKLSSLDRVELLGALEDRYQVDLNETRFTAAKTVGELESLVRASSPVHSEFVFPRWAQRWPVTWIRTFFYYLLTWPATHLLAHPRVFGRENLRGVKGPVLVVSNHVIYLDVGFVLAALPPRLRHRLAVAMGGERLAEMREPPHEWPILRRWLHRMNYFLVVSLFNVFPLPKSSGFRESFRFAGELADRGWSVLVFPEGELTPDGKLQLFRAGAGLLASNLKLPVVPIRIDGAYEIREAHKLLNRPGRIRVHIGKAVEFSAESDPQQIAKELELQVAAIGTGRE